MFSNKFDCNYIDLVELYRKSNLDCPPSDWLCLKSVEEKLRDLSISLNCQVEDIVIKNGKGSSSVCWVHPNLVPFWQDWASLRRSKELQHTNHKTNYRTQEKAQEQTSIERQINGIVVEQRVADGFINGTAMCVAHRKDISNWLKTDRIWRLVQSLYLDLYGSAKSVKKTTSVKTRITANFPELVVSNLGAPSTGGGTWLHPDLAIQLAQWCNDPFAIQVSRWVREWMIIAHNNETEHKKQEQEARYNQRIIQACVTPDASPWQKRFNDVFREEACRVTGQPPRSAWFICKYLYEQMPSGVYEELKRVNPPINKRRRNKQHQYLKDLGLTALERLQDSFITIMRLSPTNDLNRFKRNLEKAFSTTLQLELPIFEDLEETV